MILSLLAILLAGCIEQGESASAEAGDVVRPALLAEVVAADLGLHRSYPGVVEAAESSVLSFRVSGVLNELPAEPGLRVRKGDLLAALDDTDFRNALDDRRARLRLAEVQFNQMRELHQRNLASQLQLEQAEAGLKSARAAVAQAESNLRYTRLLAPFDGIVGRVSVENYQAVAAGAPVVQLQDLDRLDVVFSVPETLVARLAPVTDRARLNKLCGKVTFTTHPEQQFRACLKEYESVPDPATRNYQARFRLDPVKGFVVLPGMTVSVDLDFSQLLDRQGRTLWQVPVEAVFEEQGAHYVWVVDEGQQAVRRRVTLAGLSGDSALISEGVARGERVVAAGVSAVREGMRLKPFIKERGL